MKDNLKREHVQNHLDNIQSDCPELKNYILHDSDSRCGKRIALARVLEHGTIQTQTDYITYPEMNNLLRGYYLKSTNKLKQPILPKQLLNQQLNNLINKKLKTMQTANNFYKSVEDLKEAYFSEVDILASDKIWNNTKIYQKYQKAKYQVELFNNGCLTYSKLVSKLSAICKANETDIQNIFSKYIID